MTCKHVVRSWLGIVAAAGAIGWATGDACRAQAPDTIFGTFSTSGVYDEQITNEQGPNANGGNFMNSVDAEAAGNGKDNGTPTPDPYTLAQFKIDVQNAFDTGKGGVCSFDNDTNATNAGAKTFVALIGSALDTPLTVKRLENSPPLVTNDGINNDSNNQVISGFNYLGISGANTPVNLSFSLPLETFAITALSRNADRTMILTINYDNGTSHPFVEEALGAVADDTFFVWKAPAGRSITSVRFDNNAGYVRYDDMGFILANFQRGDVDGDLDVDLTDYNTIKNNFGLTPATKLQGDLNGDNVVNLIDFQQWKANEAIASEGAVGAVPEPASVTLAAAALCLLARFRNRR